MSMTILDKYTIDIIKIITPLVYIALGIAIYEIAKTMTKEEFLSNRKLTSSMRQTASGQHP